jgi:hypothetical protein
MLSRVSMLKMEKTPLDCPMTRILLSTLSFSFFSGELSLWLKSQLIMEEPYWRVNLVTFSSKNLPLVTFLSNSV